VNEGPKGLGGEKRGAWAEYYKQKGGNEEKISRGLLLSEETNEQFVEERREVALPRIRVAFVAGFVCRLAKVRRRGRGVEDRDSLGHGGSGDDGSKNRNNIEEKGNFLSLKPLPLTKLTKDWVEAAR